MGEGSRMDAAATTATGMDYIINMPHTPSTSSCPHHPRIGKKFTLIDDCVKIEQCLFPTLRGIQGSGAYGTEM